jgi:hypothetical protein
VRDDEGYHDELEDNDPEEFTDEEVDDDQELEAEQLALPVEHGPLSRAGDPETSRDAGLSLSPSELGELQATAFLAVVEWPGGTQLEYARRFPNLDSRKLGRRFCELERAGLIRIEGKARDPHTNREGFRYWPAHARGQLR